MVSVEDNPPSLVVIVRRCLNTRFRPKRAKNAPCKKSNYVQHLLTAWVVLVQFGLSWFILRRGYYDTIEKTRYISLSEYFCICLCSKQICLCSNQKPNPRAAVSRRLPPTSQSFDWKNQWVRVQQRLVCPKMHFPHWNVYGSSFVKIIVAIDVKYHLWPGCQSCAFFKAKSSALRTNWAPTANKGFPADLELVRGVAWQQIDPSTSQTGT